MFVYHKISHLISYYQNLLPSVFDNSKVNSLPFQRETTFEDRNLLPNSLYRHIDKRIFDWVELGV